MVEEHFRQGVFQQEKGRSVLLIYPIPFIFQSFIYVQVRTCCLTQICAARIPGATYIRGIFFLRISYLVLRASPGASLCHNSLVMNTKNILFTCLLLLVTLSAATVVYKQKSLLRVPAETAAATLEAVATATAGNQESRADHSPQLPPGVQNRPYLY